MPNAQGRRPSGRFPWLEHRSVRGRARLGIAFSLVELLVTVALLSFIVLGLLAMFGQTQRAFRSSMAQVDVLESGRALADLLARDLEEMTPSRYPDFIDPATGNLARVTNFFAELSPRFNEPLLQGLPGTQFPPRPTEQDRRTNIVERFFFLTYRNQDWIGKGYQVLPEDGDGMVGTLYRFEATNTPRVAPISLSGSFYRAPVQALSRIADGIVHLQLRAYDTNGALISTNRLYWGRNIAVQGMAFRGWGVPLPLDQVNSYFVSNAVPAAVEVELGVLEPQVLQRYRAIVNTEARREYLSNRVGQVQLFRQRIPIRNVDPSAYR